MLFPVSQSRSLSQGWERYRKFKRVRELVLSRACEVIMSFAQLSQQERDEMREHQLECIKRDKEARSWLKRPREEIQAHLDRTGDEKLRKTLNLLMKARSQSIRDIR